MYRPGTINTSTDIFPFILSKPWWNLIYLIFIHLTCDWYKLQSELHNYGHVYFRTFVVPMLLTTLWVITI